MRGRRLFIFSGCLVLLTAVVGARAESEPQQTAVPAAPAPPATKEPEPPASVTVMAPKEAHGVLGRDVKSPTDENMGRIVDILVDHTGTVRAAVIDFGGFLGVGSRKIVVDWSALHFGRVNNKGDSITLELTKAQVAAAPEYKEGTSIVVLGAAGKLSPFEDEH
jgi:hypothetical protein